MRTAALIACVAMVCGSVCAAPVSYKDSYILNPDGVRIDPQVVDASGSTMTITGSVNSANSSTTTLGASGSYTGTATDVTSCGIAFINVYSDKASATDGLKIQQSSDGTNWDHSDDYTIPAATGKNYSINPHAQYMRVVYVNGAASQTVFRLQTICKGTDAKASSHRIKDSIVGDDDCELVKAAITGENGDGVWHNVKTTADGNLTISDNSSGLAIAQGNVTGTTFIHKFGNAPDFDQGDGAVTVWDAANDTVALSAFQYTYSSTADIDSIISTSTSDTQVVEIQGLGASTNLVIQNVTLNGRTRVALSTNLLRVFRMQNENSTDFVGNISCYVTNSPTVAGVVTAEADVRAVVLNGNNQTEMAVYTVPAGKTGYMRDWYAATAGANKTSNYIMELFARRPGGVFQLKHRISISDSGTSYMQHKFEEPEVFAAGTDVEVRATMTAAGGTEAAISAGFDIVVVDD